MAHSQLGLRNTPSVVSLIEMAEHAVRSHHGQVYLVLQWAHGFVARREPEVRLEVLDLLVAR